MNILNKGKGKIATLCALIATVLCAVIAAFVIVGNTTQASAATVEEEPQISTQSAESLAQAWNAAVQESLDGEGKQVTFTLTENWTAAEDATYTTSFGSGDCFYNGRILVPEGANIKLDLNGHTIDRGLFGKTSVDGGGVIRVHGNLEIDDTATGGTIKGANGAPGIQVVNAAGNLILSNGIITENNYSYGAGVAVILGATFTMNGGAISGNSSPITGGGVSVTGNFIMNSGVISANTARNTGAGVNVEGNANNSAKFIMNGGTIGGATASDGNKSDNGGGGLNVYSQYSEAIINEGTISNNTARASVAGIRVDANATFKMYGGTVSENSAPYCGGIGCSAGAVVTIYDGYIINNEASICGGGIYVDNKATLILEGGHINENYTTSSNGGGIRIISSDSTVIMNGGEIVNNTAAGNGGGISAESSSSLFLNGGTIRENKAGSSGGGVFVSASTFTITGGTIGGETADDGNKANNGGGVYITINSTFNMNGGEISGNSASDNGGGLNVLASTATMTDGTISGNTTGKSGAGAYAYSSSTFIMTGGTISENEAASYGGGVCANSSVFDMTGGIISGNTSNEYSGGVQVGASAVFTMGGTATISTNTAKYGGGVVVDGGNFIIEGGIVSGNTATSYGGGVFVSSGTFSIGGAVQITGNNSSNVYIVSEDNSIFVIGSLTGSRIGVTPAKDSGAFTNGYSRFNKDIEPALFFFLDFNREVKFVNNEAGVGTGSVTTPTKKLTWQYRETNGAWKTAPSTLKYTGLTYEVQAVYVDGSTTTVQTIVKKTYKDLNGNTVSSIKDAGTYSFLVNSKEYNNPTLTFTITPIDVTVTWGSASFYYSGSVQNPSFTLNGVLASDKNYVTAVLNTSKAGVNAGNGYSVSIDSLTGTRAVNYRFAASAKTTCSYSIKKATPVVTPNISINERLFADKELPEISTATGNTAGTIVWKESVLTAGTKSYNWTFTPTDTANYETVTGTYILTADEVAPVSITATFNAGTNKIYTTTTLDDLKTFIKVKVTNNDGTSFDVEEYGLYGELTEGASTLTVTYSGLSTAVEIHNVQSASGVTLSSLKAEFTDGANKNYVAFDKFNPTGVIVKAVYSDGTEVQIADYTFDYADPTHDYLSANDTYVTFKYSEGEINVDCRLSGLTVVKAKPTVNPQISFNNKLFVDAKLPKIALASGDTAGTIVWAETALAEGTNSYSWTFTPTDAFNYETVTGSYIFTADKKALISIKATYAPDEDFKVTTLTTLNEIRNYVTVEGTYNDGTTGTINNFELFGTLKADKSVITVTYGGASTTFEISGVEAVKESSKVTPKVTISGVLIEGNELPAIALSAGDTAGTISWDEVDGETAKLVAGTKVYAWTFTPNDTSKYEVVTGSYTFNADPVKVVSLSVRQKVAGKAIYPGTSLDEIKDNLVVTATYNNNTTEEIDAENYKLFIKLIAGPSDLVVEYGGVIGSLAVTVTSDAEVILVDVKWLSGEYTYDGKLHMPTPYIEYNGEKILLEAELTGNYDGISAGTQEVRAVAPASGKYKLSGKTEITYSIGKAEISIVWSSDDGWTYNGEAQNPAAQVKAGYNDGKISVQYKITAKSGSTLTDGKAVNAGSYVAEVVLGGAGNYTVTGKTTFEFAIAKKKVEKPLALTSQFTYNGAAQTYLPTGFDESVMTVAGSTQTEAGAYTVTVELKDAVNYEWADGTTQKLSYSFNIGALPDAPKTENGGLAWWIILLIVLAVLALLFAVIALVAVARKKAVLADSDGFYDDVTEDDLQ